MIQTLKDTRPLLWFAALAVLMLPFLAEAQTINTLLQDISDILNTVIPILMILATLIFLWGIITYITAAGDEEKLKSARTYIIWGLIGLFVMVAVWGLVQVLLNTFGVGTPGTPLGPQQ
ncbi:MAG: hypothetical protein COU47_02305 [Candidatus Niyogibacteria bacterium CG10_big_fil_rev_8_21_14_0_10_46_36]|uniref:TrbC/VirB2 family protein n=1 Tax=Candidatus Niyogibacteria bacterium CG10_big_fil_rev_8_21_14_0_10_46_36 TaxID=1974726 RepID=A0A2H0TF32_9BACT|nr:MAG: hypothetical protein COU47_02305 [Candidatus Niyogibacteria bacterium CG10_big_fil_rev_8_21_14_0_10_46_36]